MIIPVAQLAQKKIVVRQEVIASICSCTVNAPCLVQLRSFHHRRGQQHSRLLGAFPLPSLRAADSLRRERAVATHAAPLSTLAAAASDMVLTFTPQHALLGGIVLGSAALAKLLLTGRVLGISGGLKGVVQGNAAPWRYAFNGGLMAGAILLALYMPGAFEVLPGTFSMWRAAASGILVGYGAAIGNGCTSGHGICGNARLSPRSLVYTMTFMAAGAAAATLGNTLAALHVSPVAPAFEALAGAQLQPTLAVLGASTALLGTIALASRSVAASDGGTRMRVELLSEATIGLVFALGLGLSGMTHPSKVAGFLSVFSPAWDLSLPFVMGGAVLVAMFGFKGIANKLMAKPLLCDRFTIPTSNAIDPKLLLGGALFGAGWGLSGLCPGPAMVSALGAMTPQLGVYLAAMLAGLYVEKLLPLAWLAGGGTSGPAAKSAR